MAGSCFFHLLHQPGNRSSRLSQGAGLEIRIASDSQLEPIPDRPGFVTGARLLCEAVFTSGAAAASAAGAARWFGN